MRDYQAHLATMKTDWEFGDYAVDIRNHTIGMTETPTAYVIVFELKDIPGNSPFIGGRGDYFVDKASLKIVRFEGHK